MNPVVMLCEFIDEPCQASQNTLEIKEYSYSDDPSKSAVKFNLIRESLVLFQDTRKSSADRSKTNTPVAAIGATRY